MAAAPGGYVIVMSIPRRDPLTEQVRRMLQEEEELVDPDAAAPPEPAQPGEVREESVREGLERLDGQS